MARRLPTYAPPVTEPEPRSPAFDLQSMLHDRDSFMPVLLLAIVCMVLFPFSENFRLGALIVYPASAALLVISLHHSRVHPRLMRAAIVILVLVGIGTLLSSIARLLDVGEDRHMVAVASFLYAVLFAVAFPSIVRRAFQHRNVTLNTLAAGISAYLIIGLWFATIYRGMASIQGGEFFAQPGPTRPGDFVYFSFITLTTVGYGDLTPVQQLRPQRRGDRGRARAGLPRHRRGPHREPHGLEPRRGPRPSARGPRLPGRRRPRLSAPPGAPGPASRGRSADRTRAIRPPEPTRREADRPTDPDTGLSRGLAAGRERGPARRPAPDREAVCQA